MKDAADFHKAGRVLAFEGDSMRDDAAQGADPEREQWRERTAIGGMIGEAIDLFEARASGQAAPIPVPWVRFADRIGGGFWPGAYLLVGNTGAGKSQFALQIANHAAEAGVPVLYLGLELSRSDIVARLFGVRAGVKWSGLWLGKDVASIRRLREQTSALAAMPIRAEFGDAHGFSYEDIAASAARMREEYPETDGHGSRPFLVVLDYLQIVGQSDSAARDEQLRERIGKASYAARDVARKYGATVLLVSSTARDGYARLDIDPEKLPNPAALVGLGKESGETEYSADGVFVLAREPWAEGAPTWVHVAVAKGRAFPAGWCDPLVFDGSAFREPSTVQETMRAATPKPAKASKANAEPLDSEEETPPW